jgi:hypothetical protein
MWLMLSNLLYVFVEACQNTLFGIFGRRRQSLLLCPSSDNIGI